MKTLPVTAVLAALDLLALVVCALAHVPPPAPLLDALPLLVAGHLGASVPALGARREGSAA